MTLKEAVADCIAHWERMIKWARMRKGGSPEIRYFEMKDEIGEHPTSEYCALCKMFFRDKCAGCPLGTCEDTDSLYQKVMHTETWGAWVLAAKKLLARLREIEKEDYNEDKER